MLLGDTKMFIGNCLGADSLSGANVLSDFCKINGIKLLWVILLLVKLERKMSLTLLKLDHPRVCFRSEN